MELAFDLFTFATYKSFSIVITINGEGTGFYGRVSDCSI